MLLSSRGILLNQIKYSESSLIIKVLTEELGIKSFLLKGVYAKKSPVKFSALKPLLLFEFTSQINPKSNLHYIKDFKATGSCFSVYSNVYKSSILIFLNEILNNSIREEEGNKDLFLFIEKSIKTLEKAATEYANFHLVFLIKLSKYLGFYPTNNYAKATPYFDLKEGNFSGKYGSESEKNTSINALLSQLLSCNYEQMAAVSISNTERKHLLCLLAKYYKLHIIGIKDLKSLEVLDAVFS